jgi:hypothetical protein
MQKLSHQFVANINKTGRYFDGGTCLHLLVRCRGQFNKKYWIFRYNYDGKRHDKSLGRFPSTSLAEARKRAINFRAGLNNGRVTPNSLALRVEEISSPQLFEDFSRNWIELNRYQWSSQKHYLQWISSLEVYFFPVIGACTPSTPMEQI